MVQITTFDSLKSSLKQNYCLIYENFIFKVEISENFEINLKI